MNILIYKNQYMKEIIKIVILFTARLSQKLKLQKELHGKCFQSQQRMIRNIHLECLF